MTWETAVALLLAGLLGLMGLEGAIGWFAARRRGRLSRRIDAGLAKVLAFCARHYVAQGCPSCGESAAELVRFSESGRNAEVSCSFCRAKAFRRLRPSVGMDEARRNAERFGELVRWARVAEAGEDHQPLCLAIPEAAPPSGRPFSSASPPPELSSDNKESILCPFCREAMSESLPTCSSCASPLLLNGRFYLKYMLGKGDQGITFLGLEVGARRRVVIKEVFLRPPFSPKTIEVFEQGLATHRALSHPAIPSFVDAFHVLHPGLVSFYHAREYVEGETLSSLLERGHLFTEDHVGFIGRQLLTVLDYMHGCVPPVIHRDIKPSNIVQRASDGEIVLIDFGYARRLDESGGSSVVGSPGYAPWEQLVGEAVTQSDLFALGVTLAVLLTRATPSALRDARDQRRIVLPEALRCSPRLRELIVRLVEPDLEIRSKSARVELGAFDAE